MQAINELKLLLEASSNELSRLLTGMGVNWVEGDMSLNRSRTDLSEMLRKAQALAELIGRKQLGFSLKRERIKFSDNPKRDNRFQVKLSWKMPIEKSVKALEQSHPFLIDQNAGAKVLETHHSKSARPVADYTADQVVGQVTKILQGSDLPQKKSATLVREQLNPWAKRYADTIYRNAISRAYHDGQFKQILEVPFLKDTFPAFQQNAIDDAVVRPQHLAWNDIILSIDDELLGWIRAPIHHNCRCGTLPVSRAVLQKMGRIDDFGQVTRPASLPEIPVPNFGYRPL